MKSEYILKCPNCSANLDYEDGMEVLFCKYCGTKILLTDENTYTYKKVDVAEIQKAKNQSKQIDINREIYEQETKRLEREIEKNEQSSYTIALLALILLFLGIILLLMKLYIVGAVVLYAAMMVFMFYLSKGEEKEKKSKIILKQRANLDKGLGEHIEFNSSFYFNKGKNYRIISQKFSSLGFTNIDCIPLEDLSFINRHKDGKVESVLIDGKQINQSEIYLSNDKVQIYYHSK